MFDSLIELGEKMALVARYGKLMTTLIPPTSRPSRPQSSRAARPSRSGKARLAPQRCVRRLPLPSRPSVRICPSRACPRRPHCHLAPASAVQTPSPTLSRIARSCSATRLQAMQRRQRLSPVLHLRRPDEAVCRSIAMIDCSQPAQMVTDRRRNSTSARPRFPRPFSRLGPTAAPRQLPTRCARLSRILLLTPSLPHRRLIHPSKMKKHRVHPVRRSQRPVWFRADPADPSRARFALAGHLLASDPPQSLRVRWLTSALLAPTATRRRSRCLARPERTSSPCRASRAPSTLFAVARPATPRSPSCRWRTAHSDLFGTRWTICSTSATVTATPCGPRRAPNCMWWAKHA